MGGLLHRLRHARRCYVVCAVARSGSNLLTDGLHATRRAGRPNQFFSPHFAPDYGVKYNLDPGGDFAGYVDGIINATMTSNEVFGFKLMGWYLYQFVEQLRRSAGPGVGERNDAEVLADAFPRLRFVHITRRDKLRQAISKARAMQTGVWKLTAPAPARSPERFNRDLISQCLREGEIEESFWERFFHSAQVEVLHLEYEDLALDYERTLRGVFNFLRIRLAPSTAIAPPQTIRQSDEVSAEWEDRYRMEARELIAV